MQSSLLFSPSIYVAPTILITSVQSWKSNIRMNTLSVNNDIVLYYSNDVTSLFRPPPLLNPFSSSFSYTPNSLPFHYYFIRLSNPLLSSSSIPSLLSHTLFSFLLPLNPIHLPFPFFPSPPCPCRWPVLSLKPKHRKENSKEEIS